MQCSGHQVYRRQAHQRFRLSNQHVEACISEAKKIKIAVSELVMLQDQAILLWRFIT